MLPLVRDGEGNTYQTNILSGVRLEEEDGDKVLLDDVDGTIAYKTDVGQGSLIVSTSPAWMTNGNILEKDHLSLILLLLKEGGAQEGTILFDEYLHGGESRGIPCDSIPAMAIAPTPSISNLHLTRAMDAGETVRGDSHPPGGNGPVQR